MINFYLLKNKSLSSEIEDLYREFEETKADHLETIRDLQRQEKLLLQIIERIQPCVRKDSNYA